MISDAEINALEAWYLHCADTQENTNGGRILALIKRLRDAEKELSAIRAQLRIECAEEGCNDWPDDLHLADVIEKHLCRKMAYERDALQRQLAERTNAVQQAYYKQGVEDKERRAIRAAALEEAAKVCDELVGRHGGGLCAERIRRLIQGGGA